MADRSDQIIGFKVAVIIFANLWFLLTLGHSHLLKKDLELVISMQRQRFDYRPIKFNFEFVTIIVEFYQLTCLAWLKDQLFKLDIGQKQILNATILIPSVYSDTMIITLLCIIFCMPVIIMLVVSVVWYRSKSALSGICGSQILKMLIVPVLTIYLNIFSKVDISSDLASARTFSLIYVFITIFSSMAFENEKSIVDDKKIQYNNPHTTFIMSLIAIFNSFTNNLAVIFIVNILSCVALIGIIFYTNCHKSVYLKIFHIGTLVLAMWSSVLSLIVHAESYYNPIVCVSVLAVGYILFGSMMWGIAKCVGTTCADSYQNLNDCPDQRQIELNLV
jgi:hypothetical protein